MERSKNRLVLKYPASWWGDAWREALPSGNGRIGAAVYGALRDETVLINHADLWHWGKKDLLPDISYTLPEVRKLMAEGKFTEASWLSSNTLKNSGYDTRLAAKLPLGDLKIQMACKNAFRHYRRILDMETGEVCVKWEDGTAAFQRSLFVSRADELLAYEMKAEKGRIDAVFSLAMHAGEDPHAKTKLAEVGASLEIKAEGSFIYYAARNDDGKDFGAVLRLIAPEGEMRPKDGKLEVTHAGRVLVLLKVFVESEREKEWPRLAAELENTRQGYDELRARHVKLHKPLFDSAAIRLSEGPDERSNEELLLESYAGEAPDSLVEKMWAYGRYLFISATRADGQPCSMYGLWGGAYRLMWCHNMANENIQMIHWHVPVGGLTELMPAFFRYYERLMDDFRDNAKRLFGCRGIYIPAGSTPGIGVPNQIVPVIMNWTGAAGWLAHHFYTHYLYTGELQFLKDSVLPFMKEVALFYEDFLVKGEDGDYLYCPSVSPENTPQNFMPKDGKPLAHPMPTAINATMDFAILKELLSNLIAGSKAAGVYAPEIGKWEEMLSHIPPYQVNEEGAVREWMHPLFDDRYDHRHLSHIYPVFPGQEVKEEDDPGLFRAFKTAVRKRLIGAQSGWSLAHMACIYARLGDGDGALECLDILARSCLTNNFYTLHNDWRNMGICMYEGRAPIQMDANMGWVNAVQEMLFYSSPRFVKLLPACPKRWKKGSVRDFRFCSGSVSFRWDLDNGSVDIDFYAVRNTEMRVKLPEQFDRYTWKGEAAEAAWTDESRRYLQVRMRPGSRLAITGSGSPLLQTLQT